MDWAKILCWKGYFEDYYSNTAEAKVIGSGMNQNMYNSLKIYLLT